MRNLKKVLTLVLTVAMVLSIMVVGTGAAFSDQDSIKNKEAVDVCTTLNIIAGMEDGSYRPANNVTRAQMCKMICVALNGGKEPTLGTNATPTFSDVRTDPSSSWAESFIESCNSQGIVSGVGGGRFSPSGSVTGTQAARMLLVALGYRADQEGFTGDAWAINVNTLASAKGLYKGIESIDANAALSRDNAAQMIWNALNAYEVEYVSQLVTVDGNLTSKLVAQDKVVGNNRDKITMLEDKYEAKTFTGIFDGDSNVTSAKAGQIQVNGKMDESEDSSKAKFTYNLDLKYIGEEVKVLFRDGTGGTKNVPDDKDTIYGVYITGGTSVVNAVLNDIDDNYKTAGKVSVKDTAYKVSELGTIIKNYDAKGQVTSWGTKGANASVNKADGVSKIEKLSATNGNTVKFILNDSDEITTAYVNEYNITKISAANSSKISLYNVASIDIADNEVYDGAAKDDVVVFQRLYSANDKDATFVVTKAESVSGNLAGFKTTEKVTIDGTTYSTMDKVLKDKLTTDCKTILNNNDINSAVTAYMVNGFVGCIDVAASSTNYALVIDKNTGAIGGIDDFKMKVILSDGTQKIVSVDEDSTKEGTTTKFATGDFGKGDLIKYSSISDSNVMDVTKIVKDAYESNGTTAKDIQTATAANNVYDKDTKSFAQDAGVSSYKISTSDAVLFVHVTDNNKYYAYNMRTLGNIKATKDATKFFSALDKDGARVEAAFVELASKPSGATTDTVYGIVTAANGNVKVSDEYKAEYKVANDKGEYTVYMPTNATVVKGDIVSFEKASDDIYSNADVKVYTAANAKYLDGEIDEGALSYYDAIGGTLVTKALDSDAQIVYVNQDKDSAGTDIGVGEYETLGKYANAVVVMDSNNAKIVAIIVESSRECNIVNGMPTKVTVTNEAAVKQQPDGIYVPDDSFAPAGGVAGNAEDNVIFKYTASKGSGVYTLTIKSGDTTVYTETFSSSDSSAHFFWITTNPVNANAGTEAGTWVSPTGNKAPAGTYTGTVTAADGTVVLSESFTVR